MANGNVIRSVEHNGESPFDYSIKEQLEYYASIQENFSPVAKQTYLPGMTYSPFQFRDYAGVFIYTPPNPIILPSDRAYNGIAPMHLMPTIGYPYPYEQESNYGRY